MDAKTMVLTADDSEIARSIRNEAIKHNLAVLGAGLSAGLSIDLLAPMCIPLGGRKSPQARELTEHDKQRISAAEAKRQRRAKKLAATPTHPTAQQEE